jgi:ABC-type transporter MlaC component
LLFGPIAAAVLEPTAAQAATIGAERFVADRATEVIGLADDPASASRSAAFQRFVDGNVDMNYLVGRVLGQYGNFDRNPAYANDRAGFERDRAEFQSVFREYMISQFETYLAQYGGDGFSVTGSTLRSAGNFTIDSSVRTVATTSPLQIQWLVAETGGRYLIQDVSAEGARLSTNERDALQPLIANAGGRLGPAITQMRNLTAQRRARLASGG